MNKAILITGIAGTGKSYLSEELVKRGYKSFDLEEVPRLFKMVHKRTGKTLEKYDKKNLKLVKQLNWVCDKSKLKRLINKNSLGIVFYCGAASNLDELLSLFDKIFFLKVDRKVLGKRLITRTSNDFGRAEEVQKWILSYKQWWENDLKKKGAIQINSNRNINDIIDEILSKVE